MFSRTSRNSCAPRTKRLKDIRELSEAAICWIHNELLSSGLNKHIHSLQAAERKGSSVRSSYIAVTVEEFLFGANKPLFSSTSCQRPTVTVTFVFIYLIFYCLFFSLLNTFRTYVNTFFCFQKFFFCTQKSNANNFLNRSI